MLREAGTVIRYRLVAEDGEPKPFLKLLVPCVVCGGLAFSVHLTDDFRRPAVAGQPKVDEGIVALGERRFNVFVGNRIRWTLQVRAVGFEFRKYHFGSSDDEPG